MMRRTWGWWLAAAGVLAGVVFAFAHEAHRASQPVYGLDRVSWTMRTSVASPGAKALEGPEWTHIDLVPRGDLPGTGARALRPNDSRREGAPPEEVLAGGASSTFATRMVERMEPGVTYDLIVEAAPAGPLDPAARIYLARELQDADRAVPPLAEQALTIDPEDRDDLVRITVRYTAGPDEAGGPLFAHLESRAALPGAGIHWDDVQLLAYPPPDSPRVIAMRRQRILEEGLGVIAYGGVVALLAAPQVAQLLVLALLVVLAHEQRGLPSSGWVRVLLVLGLAVAPLQELFAWGALSVEEWQGDRGAGYWRYVWTGPRAWVWLPWGVAASCLVAAAAIIGPAWSRSRLVAGVLIARAAASVPFFFAAWIQQVDSNVLGTFDSSLLFVLPLASVTNDLLFARMLRGRSSSPLLTPGLRVWLLGWTVTLGSQLVAARGAWSRLTPVEPEGACFVVTAAAHGHPRFVRSWAQPDGSRANAQLETLRELESQLRMRAPRFHRGLRAVYNRAGPVAASWIGGPCRADLAYLALKPLEWLARLDRRIHRMR